MTRHIVSTLRWAERLRNSRNGNPRWRIGTDDGPLITTSDGAVGYDVANRTSGGLSWVGRRVRFHLTRAGRVTHMELED